MTVHVQIPSASGVGQLAVPHFGLGLGIGVVDAALVPLLASLMDSRYAAHYGSVYALQQMAVSLAYSLGMIFLIFRCQPFILGLHFSYFFLTQQAIFQVVVVCPNVHSQLPSGHVASYKYTRYVSLHME
jgi:MFS family permease